MKTGLNILLLNLPILSVHSCLEPTATVFCWTGTKFPFLSDASSTTPQPGTQSPLLRAQPLVTGSPTLPWHTNQTGLLAMPSAQPMHYYQPPCALAHAALSSTLPAQILPILSDTAHSLPDSLGQEYLSFLWRPLAFCQYFCFCTTVFRMEISLF